MRALPRTRGGASLSPCRYRTLALGGNGPAPTTRLAAVERQHILTVVRQAQGNISQAARALGIHRATLYRKLVALGLGPEHLREERTE